MKFRASQQFMPMSATLARCLIVAVALQAIGIEASHAQSAAYSWGYNTEGQLGNGGYDTGFVPAPVPNLPSGVSVIEAGPSHSLAIRNGAAYAWGRSGAGQLGNGSTANSAIPVPVSGLGSGVTALAAGYECSLAVQNGAALAWGYNLYGQLGNNSTANSSVPVPVSGMSSGVTALAAGYGYNLALQNGTIYAWGLNRFGQLGNNSTTDSRVPVPVTGLGSEVAAISAGYGHCLALRNGAVYAWGNNASGQLGNGTTTNSSVPVPVIGLDSGVTAIAAGGYHCMAIRNGNVFVWGSNLDGQLGDGTKINRTTPFQVHAADLKNDVKDIVAMTAGFRSSHALASDGSVWEWGGNEFFVFGLGQTGEKLRPVRLLPPSGYAYTALNTDENGTHMLAILAPALVTPVVTTTKVGPSTFNFTFPTKNALIYQLQRSGDLSAWTNVGTAVAGDGSVKTLSDTSSAGRGYWRVSVQRASN